MFSSMTFGIVLYASHILSSTILAIVLNAFSKKQKEPHDHKIISIQKRKNLENATVLEFVADETDIEEDNWPKKIK